VYYYYHYYYVHWVVQKILGLESFLVVGGVFLEFLVELFSTYAFVSYKNVYLFGIFALVYLIHAID